MRSNYKCHIWGQNFLPCKADYHAVRTYVRCTVLTDVNVIKSVFYFRILPLCKCFYLRIQIAGLQVFRVVVVLVVVVVVVGIFRATMLKIGVVADDKLNEV